LVERRPGHKPEKIEDPRYNSHTTDIKPLFPDEITEFPYVITRNRNAINLIDLRNRHTQPLIEIRNSDLFCEKLCLTIDPDSRNIRLMYVSWQKDHTFVKEIQLPGKFIETLKSAADL
jgi:hypothetical protein